MIDKAGKTACKDTPCPKCLSYRVNMREDKTYAEYECVDCNHSWVEAD